MNAGQSAPESMHFSAHSKVTPGAVDDKLIGSCLAVRRKWPVTFSKVKRPPSQLSEINRMRRNESRNTKRQKTGCL